MPIAPLLARVQRFAARTGWFYGLALAVAAGTLAAFGHLADEVREKEFDAFNHGAVLGLHAHASPLFDQGALALAALGSPVGITLMGLLLGAFFAQRRRVLDAFTLAVALLGAGVLTFT